MEKVKAIWSFLYDFCISFCCIWLFGLRQEREVGNLHEDGITSTLSSLNLHVLLNFYWGLGGNFIKVHLGSTWDQPSRCCMCLQCRAGQGQRNKPHACLPNCKRHCLSGMLTRSWQNALAVWLLRRVHPRCSPWIAQRKPEEALGAFAVLPWWNITLAAVLERLHALPNLSYKQIMNVYDRRIPHL